jgi:hypothetical protein
MKASARNPSKDCRLKNLIKSAIANNVADCLSNLASSSNLLNFDLDRSSFETKVLLRAR